MSLSGFSVKRKVTITMLAFIIVLIGTISYTKLGVDLMPDIEFPTVSIITPYSGASSEDVEEMVTKPIEEWISTVSNVKDVKSISKEGISIINVEFEWGTNLDFAAQDIRETIGIYEKFLPENVSKPVVLKFDVSQFPILMYGITGKRNLFELKKIVEDEVAERLARTEGVASAVVFSSEEREIRIELKKDKIKALNLSPDEILRIVSAENLNQPAGYITQDKTEYIIRTVGEFSSIDEIKKIPVGYTKTGKVIRLSDVANVIDGRKDIRSITRVSGKEGIFLVITKSSGANTAIVGKAVKKKLKKIIKTLPEDIKFHIAMDQSSTITDIARSTGSNVIMGGILVVFLIFLFLSNWRPTITIIISIPLSIIATFISFYVAGYTLNLITLVGLGLGVGMLVDNSVVVIENVFRHLEEGEDSEKASVNGTNEVAMAITASTLTTIGVFFPMLFTTGIVGKFAQALALSVSFALVSSLFVALTIVPMLTSVIFKGADKEEIYDKASKEKSFEKYRNLYRKLLDMVLRKKYRYLTGVVLLFFISLGLLKFTGSEFMPPIDRSFIVMRLKLPIGTPLDITSDIARGIEEKIRKRPEVLSVTTTIGIDEKSEQGGASDAFSPRGPHEAVFWVKLKPKKERKYTGIEIMEQIKQSVPHYRGEKLEVIDIGRAMMGSSMYPVDVKVMGKDLEVLKKISDIVVKNMKAVRGFTDVHSSFMAGKKEVHIKIKREKAYSLGLTVYQIASAIHTYTIGKAYTKFREHGEEYDIRVLLRESDRNTISKIETLPIKTPMGKTVYLKDIAEFKISEGPFEIERENKTRKISVYGNIVGRDLGSAVEELKMRLEELEKNLPPGYFIEYGGQYEDMKEGFRDLFFALIIAILLVYMIMASQFENLLHPFVIMFTVPLAFIGVVFALLLKGEPLSVIVFMGIIILSGIAVNNGIVMVDYINQLRERGLSPYKAVIEGAVVRLRPVLITATSTITGMLPMVFTKSEGAESRIPLGLAIVGGLTAATFLTLFVVPIIYTIVNKIKPEE